MQIPSNTKFCKTLKHLSSKELAFSNNAKITNISCTQLILKEIT